MLIDDTGRVLDDVQSLLAFVSLMSGSLEPGAAIALPLVATMRAEELAREHGVEVIRTKLSNSALMAAAAKKGVAFAASTNGGFILPAFLPSFDAAAALVKLLELLAIDGVALSKVVGSLPAVHIAHETVVTPWEQKGAVMRSLVELSKDRQVELVDGVRVLHDDGWALALPDPEEPVTHVWAEALDEAGARRLVQEYARRIRQLLR
jgi:mannose-1-phosphate guanylyltransferase/phosphomannomutase